jgi:hypothetical protein
MVAPETIGTHTGYWILANGSGAPFGSYITAKIIVSKPKP